MPTSMSSESLRRAVISEALLSAARPSCAACSAFRSDASRASTSFKASVSASTLSLTSFGKETKGLPDHLLESHDAQALQIPLYGPIRSLNLATAVAIVLYEGLRQLYAHGHDHRRT